MRNVTNPVSDRNHNDPSVDLKHIEPLCIKAAMITKTKSCPHTSSTTTSLGSLIPGWHLRYCATANVPRTIRAEKSTKPTAKLVMARGKNNSAAALPTVPGAIGDLPHPNHVATISQHARKRNSKLHIKKVQAAPQPALPTNIPRQHKLMEYYLSNHLFTG
ncbi:hypothetical protein EPHNCH_1306 [Anaplasma phagocytophilum str. NCH-1]|nr:hypothetical protein EPHNCH_1306 [Anaplasma phagocytophilum str. NCH-1]KJV83493.1 hypothetical protein APHHGE2_1287 [Anaplasma phagocytophilum str. HGE2]